MCYQRIEACRTWWGNGKDELGLGVPLIRRSNGWTMTRESNVSHYSIHWQTTRLLPRPTATLLASTYRRYILPLFPTLATVNCRPSRPAELPSGVISLRFPSSTSRCAQRLTLFSFCNPSCHCFFLARSGDFLPMALARGAGHRVIPPFRDPSVSGTVVAILLDFPNRPRGERRSRCRCRKSSVRDPAGSVA
jgi:hypothetical protein